MISRFLCAIGFHAFVRVKHGCPAHLILICERKDCIVRYLWPNCEICKLLGSMM